MAKLGIQSRVGKHNYINGCKLFFFNINEHQRLQRSQKFITNILLHIKKTRNILVLQNQVNGRSVPLRLLIFCHRCIIRSSSNTKGTLNQESKQF